MLYDWGGYRKHCVEHADADPLYTCFWRTFRGRICPSCAHWSSKSKLMHHAISELIRTTLLLVGALFPLVNSPENIPIFLTLTAGVSTENRSILARKIALNGFALLLASVLIGTHILAFFGISLPVVQVGGGLIVISGGWKLLNRPDEEKVPEAAPKPVKASYLSRRAFYPLTLPLTVGPGAISVAVAVGASRPPGSEVHWALPVAAFVACAMMAIGIYFGYRFAEPIGRMFGETALSVTSRLSSFILICIGVQIVWNGASQLLASIA
jgi:multiple antibiotic resistance protein